MEIEQIREQFINQLDDLYEDFIRETTSNYELIRLLIENLSPEPEQLANWRKEAREKGEKLFRELHQFDPPNEEALEFAHQTGWDYSPSNKAFIKNENVRVVWWRRGWAPWHSACGVFDSAVWGSPIGALQVANKMFQ